MKSGQHGATETPSRSRARSENRVHVWRNPTLLLALVGAIGCEDNTAHPIGAPLDSATSTDLGADTVPCTPGTLDLTTPGDHAVDLPLGCTSVVAHLWGAGGGGSINVPNQGATGGGGGAYVRVDLTVDAPVDLRAVVAGGGKGGQRAPSSCAGAGGGGGASLFYVGDQLVAAAAGGGGGSGLSTLVLERGSADGNAGGSAVSTEALSDGGHGGCGGGADKCRLSPGGHGGFGLSGAAGGNGGGCWGGGGGGGGSPGGHGGAGGLYMDIDNVRHAAGGGGGSSFAIAEFLGRFDAGDGLEPGNAAEANGAGRGAERGKNSGSLGNSGQDGRIEVRWSN